jgi:hypothetical protein
MAMKPKLLLLLLLAGCDNSAAERVKLAEQQKQAEQKLAKAERQAKEEIERLKSELGEAKSKLEEATKSQANAAEEGKQLEVAVEKARKAYKALAKNELDDLNKEARELSVKAAKAPAKAKAAASKALQDVSAKQKSAAKELAEFDDARLETLDTVKAKLDKELAALRASIRAAKAKLP